MKPSPLFTPRAAHPRRPSSPSPAAATAALSAWTLHAALTARVQEQGAGPSPTPSPAPASKPAVPRPASVQAVIDQYAETKGSLISSLIDPHGEVLCHTFAPRVPAEVLGLDGGPARHDGAARCAWRGTATASTFRPPILAGQIGYVHVGMELSHISTVVGNAMLLAGGADGLVFLAGVAAAYLLMMQHLPAAAPADARGREGRDPGRAGPGRGGGRQRSWGRPPPAATRWASWPAPWATCWWRSASANCGSRRRRRPCAAASAISAP